MHFKDLVINPCPRCVLINNNSIELTTKESDLLYFLARHPGWAFTKAQIYETVWDEQYVHHQHAVENIIYHLRRKMALNTTNTNYIQTLVGYSYKFLAT
ncbi:winged helix-turn-helix domain-containing protein [Kineothrix alysoides]|nr:winged helix-turn-helix domain-containing protein [Kineothrix alysoides]